MHISECQCIFRSVNAYFGVKCIIAEQPMILPEWQEMLTLSGTLDFTPFGEFMILPIHYMALYIHCIICQSKDYVYGLMTMVCLPGLV